MTNHLQRRIIFLLHSKPLLLVIATLTTFSILCSGCSMFQPLKKPDMGPAGTPATEKSNPPLTERFMSPPGELYDLETTAGVVFEGIIKNDWLQAAAGLKTLQQLWPHTKSLVGDKKGVTAASAALEELVLPVSEKNPMDSYESLTKFMASIGDIGKSYKLSPLSDIVGVNNAIRKVAFYVTFNDWHKATIKMKELDSTWGQAKPSMESIGVFGKITTTHSIIKQMKDAVEAEDKAAVEADIGNINESMAYIRDYYHNK